MHWLSQLHSTQPVAQAIGILAMVCVAGMTLGSLRVRGIGLGTAGVLFAGMIVGYFSKPVDHATLDFVKEFGLILFVFTIGLQLGPQFFSALRRQGLRLNALAVVIVLSGSLLAVMLGWLLGLDSAGVLGILSGATTNTPSLGAGQQAITTVPGISDERQALPALAYAVTYPAAIAGIIGTLLGVKALVYGYAPKDPVLTTADAGRAAPSTKTTPAVNAHDAGPESVGGEESSDTHFVSLFIGIVLGVIVGTIPIAVPGLPKPVQLGLAGGPLVVALALGHWRRIGPLTFSMPAETNLAFREFGIALFFAAVGLAAGPGLFATVFSPTGLQWLAVGLCVTVLPLLLMALFARTVLGMNFPTLGGLLAGSMTDPPALTLMNTLSRSEAPMLAYVTVYPMTTLLRILMSQVMALTLVS
ncbi:MAG TPA: LysO family transporter [Vicinamibacterales bacterium]|nr:LysO family transporter [Vicinamibacterales bacterium]